MAPVIFHHDGFEVSTDIGPDIRDITSQVENIVAHSGIRNGSCHLTTVGSTGSLTTIEYEPGVVNDLKRAIEDLAPPGIPYEHEKAWHDGNGHSHVQAALLGPSLVLPIRDGHLALGTWQQVVVVNHDNRSRRRRVEVSVVGVSR